LAARPHRLVCAGALRHAAVVAVGRSGSAGRAGVQALWMVGAGRPAGSPLRRDCAGCGRDPHPGVEGFVEFSGFVAGCREPRQSRQIRGFRRRPPADSSLDQIDRPTPTQQSRSISRRRSSGGPPHRHRMQAAVRQPRADHAGGSGADAGLHGSLRCGGGALGDLRPGRHQAAGREDLPAHGDRRRSAGDRLGDVSRVTGPVTASRIPPPRRAAGVGGNPEADKERPGPRRDRVGGLTV